MLCNQKFIPDARSSYALSVACPLWVKSRYSRRKKSCPLYPRKRTFAVHQRMSAKGQKRTLSDLIDDLVRHTLIGQIDWIKLTGLTFRRQLCSLLHQRAL